MRCAVALSAPSNQAANRSSAARPCGTPVPRSWFTESPTPQQTKDTRAFPRPEPTETPATRVRNPSG
ncbi:hypothetical protein Nans01_36140 [Nocardiopsis ansamitocini]|uniref:Uncharacterized protein n=1 Tax=Nocardiopsis ansamitocini TaxID=1670832 RepID=A0A9W6UK69_9ACTN|nr:hypothetical protein Nans01_36140 [Nocardiopsis ansamitocini]